MTSLFRFTPECVAVFLILSIVPPNSAHADSPPVEALLQKYCLGCHNDKDPESGLSLQTPESIKKGSDNGAVLTPDDLPSSLLLSVLDSKSDQAMPPEGEPQPSATEFETLRRWVLAGAKIRSMAAGRPTVPETKPYNSQATPPLLASGVIAGTGHVVVGGDRYVARRESVSRKEIWSVRLDDVKVSNIFITGDGSQIVAAAGLPGVDGRAILLSSDDGRIVKTFGGHTDAVYAAVLNPAETIMATAGYDRRILLHDVDTGEVLRVLEGHNGSVFSLAFGPDGDVLCSASADGTVKVWEVESGQRLDTMSQPQAEQYAVMISQDGDRIVAAGGDNRIRLWHLVSMDSPKINPLIVSRFAHEQPVTCLAMSPSGSLVASASDDKTVRIWTLAGLDVYQSFSERQANVTSMSFTDEQHLFVTYIDGTTELLAISEPSDVERPMRAAKHAAPSTAMADDLHAFEEAEGNDTPATAQSVNLPAEIAGAVATPGDVDYFRFTAEAGQQLILAVHAEKRESLLDSKIAVLTADGEPILRTRLQAVRDSYFTFRGKDSDTSNDFRVFNWQEMELNEYLYSDGEVVRLWLYPRGPDSGFKVYPGFGKRHTWFGTTPTAHALQAPCFIVVPMDPDEEPVANGLPSFPIYFENDDDPTREHGRDSRLFFTAPEDGDYVVCLSDSRGFSGEGHSYELEIRAPKPSFTVSHSRAKLNIGVGTGQEIVFTAKRIDGYEGPINVSVTGLPEGIVFSGPVQIQSNQRQAAGTLYAISGAKTPTAEQMKQVAISAASPKNSVIGERTVSVNSVEEITIEDVPKVRLKIVQHQSEAGTGKEGALVTSDSAEPLTLEMRPGTTIRAVLEVERNDHSEVISFGKEDAGRNLPHGVFVDNIGLNGLLLLAEQNQREFFITAAKTATPTECQFFLKCNVDGITSFPVKFRVVP